MTSGFRDPSGHFVDRLFRPETRDGVSTGSGSDWVAVDSKDRDCQDCYPVAAPGTDLILRSRHTSYTLTAAVRDGLGSWTRAVIKPVDLFLHFSRKTDSMQFVTAPQPPYGFTYFADFPKPGTGIAIFDIDARARLDAFRGVVAIVGNIARVIFDEIVFRQEAALDDDAARRVQKLFSFGLGHVEIDSLKKPSVDKSLA